MKRLAKLYDFQRALTYMCYFDHPMVKATHLVGNLSMLHMMARTLREDERRRFMERQPRNVYWKEKAILQHCGLAGSPDLTEEKYRVLDTRQRLLPWNSRRVWGAWPIWKCLMTCPHHGSRCGVVEAVLSWLIARILRSGTGFSAESFANYCPTLFVSCAAQLE